MPDIKTALEKALAQTAKAWAADDEAHQKIETQQEKAMTMTVEQHDKRVTNNVSRVTFYFIRDNAGMTSEQVTKTLMDQGFKATSVSSLIAQMLRMRMIMADEQGRLSAVIKEYIPTQSKTTTPAAKKHTRTPRPEVSYERKKVTLVNPATGEVLNPKPGMLDVLPNLPTADSVIANMSVGEAFRLYTKLKTMFGGAQ